MLDEKIVIEATNSGDRSVGISPAYVTITIESNVSADETASNILYQDNLKMFLEDVCKFCDSWIDEMPFWVERVSANGKVIYDINRKRGKEDEK